MELVLAVVFSTVSFEQNLPPGMLQAVCFIESGYHIKYVHFNDGGSSSYGVCQVKYETAKWLGFKGTVDELMEPRINAYYAAKYLKHNLRRYHGDIRKAIIAYNQGSANHLTRSEYSDKVIAYMEAK